MAEIVRPGGVISNRELHFFWIVDCSGSMTVDGKIQSLNNAIREALPHMKSVAEENPHAKMILKAIKFSNGPTWHIHDTPLDDFSWTDLEAKNDELTAMGAALSMVAKQIKIPPMPERGLPPVLVLVSDGMPSDDFNKGFKELMEQPWAKKAIKVSIAIGKDAEISVLQKFIDNDERKPLPANTPEQLAKLIKWVSTVVVKIASSPPTKTTDEVSKGTTPIPEPPMPEDDPTVNADDVW